MAFTRFMLWANESLCEFYTCVFFTWKWRICEWYKSGRVCGIVRKPECDAGFVKSCLNVSGYWYGEGNENIFLIARIKSGLWILPTAKFLLDLKLLTAAGYLEIFKQITANQRPDLYRSIYFYSEWGLDEMFARTVRRDVNRDCEPPKMRPQRIVPVTSREPIDSDGCSRILFPEWVHPVKRTIFVNSYSMKTLFWQNLPRSWSTMEHYSIFEKLRNLILRIFYLLRTLKSWNKHMLLK